MKTRLEVLNPLESKPLITKDDGKLKNEMMEVGDILYAFQSGGRVLDTEFLCSTQSNAERTIEALERGIKNQNDDKYGYFVWKCELVKAIGGKR